MPDRSSTAVRRAPSLTDEVARLIGAEVSSGRLQPGDRLPTEQQMCDSYGVSRAVVREAVSRLKSDGLLVSHQGRGVFVNPDGPRAAFRMDVPDLDDKAELAHIVELLGAVEGTAAGLAAERRTKKELAAIKRHLDGMARAVKRGDDGVEDDLRFHQTIALAAHNPFFVSLVDFLDARVRRLMLVARANTARIEGLADKVQAEHEAIFEAIAARDPAAARAAAESHLRNAAQRLRLYRGGDANDPTRRDAA